MCTCVRVYVGVLYTAMWIHNTYVFMPLCVGVCACVCVSPDSLCVCVCVCVSPDSLCVCVCVCVTFSCLSYRKMAQRCVHFFNFIFLFILFFSGYLSVYRVGLDHSILICHLKTVHCRPCSCS